MSLLWFGQIQIARSFAADDTASVVGGVTLPETKQG